MGTAQTFPPPPLDPGDLTTESAASSGSFWTGAPKLLAAVATLLGSIVALTTVLVQAGVIGSSAETTQTVRSLPDQAVSVDEAVAKTPSLAWTLGDLNSLLAKSARTKGNLGTLIADVRAGAPGVDRATAIGRIDEIVSQRERLHAELAAFSAPSELSTALALLRDSITASLADDRLVRQWIVAHYDGDPAADALWQAQLEASRAASEAKRVFRAEYADRLAASGLSGFIPDY